MQHNLSQSGQLVDNIRPDVWKMLKYMIWIGCVSIIILSIAAYWNVPKAFSHIVVSLGTGLLISLACFSIGGLMGFLFAVPKILQYDGSVESKSVNNKTTVVHNDNLVQISDWITKIIVGVGLTQLYNIPRFISKIGDKLSFSFGMGPIGANIGIGCFLYFTVIGFLSVYIWTRLHFISLLNEVNRDLEKQVKVLEESVISLAEENEFIVGEKDIIQKQKEKLLAHNKEAARKEEENVRTISAVAPALSAVKNPDDPQKGRFGGKAENNGRRLSAKVEATIATSFFKVSIWVESTDLTRPLNSDVIFYLHDSFRPSVVTILPGDFKDGVAIDDQILAWGAFTVGAVTDNGETLLELDLAELPDAPTLFKER